MEEKWLLDERFPIYSPISVVIVIVRFAFIRIVRLNRVDGIKSEGFHTLARL